MNMFIIDSEKKATKNYKYMSIIKMYFSRGKPEAFLRDHSN